jgi:TrmH family RNA methyltransferase
MPIRFVLNRPRNAQNIGSAARALANTGAGPLWVVEGEQFDRTQAARLAAGADATLDAMQVVRTLEDAIAPCVDLVFTTGRAVDGLPLLTPREAAGRLLASAKTGEVAIVFGDEVRGLTNEQLRKAPAIATIPTVEKASLNLAQSVLVFAYEIMLARGNGKAGQEGDHLVGGSSLAPDETLAEEKMLNLLRENARELLLSSGFLNKQKPDVILDELNRMIRRAKPTKREIELLLGAVAQVSRLRPD